MAAAGVFLDRRQLIAAAALSALAVGALVIGERTGHIGPPAAHDVGLVHWIAYVTIFGCVGLGAHHARTLLQRALEQAQHNARHLARLFNLVPVSLTVTRAADGKILEANAADERYSGYRREERVALQVRDLGAVRLGNPHVADQHEEACSMNVRLSDSAVHVSGVLSSLSRVLRLRPTTGPAPVSAAPLAAGVIQVT